MTLFTSHMHKWNAKEMNPKTTRSATNHYSQCRGWKGGGGTTCSPVAQLVEHRHRAAMGGREFNSGRTNTQGPALNN